MASLIKKNFLAPVQTSTATDMPNQFIKLEEVRELSTLSTSEIYRRISVGTFPKQVLLGPKSAVWIRAEILEWQQLKIAARNSELADTPNTKN